MKEMPAHQVRVIEERNDLKSKVERLETFLDKRPLPLAAEEVHRMTSQLHFMRGYLYVLDCRILAFFEGV